MTESCSKIPLYQPVQPADVYVFDCSKDSREPLPQQVDAKSELAKHPDLGPIISIQASTSMGRSVVLHLPISQLYRWLGDVQDGAQPQPRLKLVDLASRRDSHES